MLGPMRSRAGDVAAAGSTNSATHSICSIVDSYAQICDENRWKEIANVYDQRRNDDNFAEILDLSAPTSRLADLRGWHLERMAVGEFDAAPGTASSEYGAIKQKSRPIKRTLRKILANAQKHQAKRDVFVAAMVKQRDALLVELEDAKEFLSQVHLLAAQNDPKTIEYSLPAPVEQRFLQAANKPMEPSEDEEESAEEDEQSHLPAN